MPSRSDEALDLVFRALADTTRRKMLKMLASGDRRVTDLARPHAISLPAISRHIRVLTSAGLIRQRKDAQFRRCELAGAELKNAADWLEGYRELWDRSFDALERHLDRKSRSKKKAKKKNRRRPR